MFKIGDKIVCIDDYGLKKMDGRYQESYLTKGKIYDIKGMNKVPTTFDVDNDKGRRRTYNIKRFMLLTAYRKLKIDKIRSNKL